MMRSVSQDAPIGSSEISLAQLNERSREIFRQIVESYLATGEPVGSRNLSRIIPMTLSPASVRNVMQDLEQLGLIYAPHTSAGRLPTELGLRFFVDALMQIGDLTDRDRVAIEGQVAAAGKTVENVLNEASGLLSGLTHAAGVGLTAKSMLVTLPCALLLLDYWPLKRLGGSNGDVPEGPTKARWLLFEKLPLFALAVASSVVTVAAQRNVHGVQLPTIEQIEKTPEADTITVFVPRPVGDVGAGRASRRRR